MAHLPSNDSLVIANSNLEIECYSYQSLQAFTNNDISKQKDNFENNENAAVLQPAWIANLGEQSNHMKTHLNKYTEKYDVVVACDQSLFILTDEGTLRYQKRFEYTPSCLKTYHLSAFGADIYEDHERSAATVIEDAESSGTMNTPGFMYMLGSFNNFVLIYKDVRLVWAAKTPVTPIYVDTAEFEGRKGLIVTLSDKGFLQVSYLGTEQLTHTGTATSLKNAKKIDYNQVNNDHA